VGIDPFLPKEYDRKQLKRGPQHSTDRGRTLMIKGLSPMFCSDGTYTWVHVSRGPNGEFDLSEDEMKDLLQVGDLDVGELYDRIDIASYDPTNGSISGGDVIAC
jgi:hypothetical protein